MLKWKRDWNPRPRGTGWKEGERGEEGEEGGARTSARGCADASAEEDGGGGGRGRGGGGGGGGGDRKAAIGVEW